MTSKANFSVAAVQMASETGESALNKNLEKAHGFLKEAAQQGARLIVLPEAFNYGYQLEPELLKQVTPADGTTDFLKTFAQDHQVYLSAGILERENDQIFNRSITVAPSGAVKKYTKVHLFASAPTWEDKVFVGGKTRQTMTTELGQLGFLICYDLRFPEIARALALEGSNIFVISSAWGYARGEHFEALAKARAIENQVFLISADQVGQTREGLRFAGRSSIIDPLGNLLARADSEQETVLVAEIKPEVQAQAKEFMNCFAHRIPEAYTMKDL